MVNDPFVLSRKFPAAPAYLVQLYLFDRDGIPVVGSRISERLGVSPSAVTQSLKRLEEQRIVTRDSGRGFALTSEGRALAERIVSRHYLLERLLVDQLQVDWDVADEEAELLQGSLTDRLEQILFDRLGRPQTCPHGNPFPGATREPEILASPPLTSFRPGAHVRLVRVTELGEMEPGLLKYCSDTGLRVGSRLELVSMERDQVTVRLEGNLQRIPRAFAGMICCVDAPRADGGDGDGI